MFRNVRDGQERFSCWSKVFSGAGNCPAHGKKEKQMKKKDIEEESPGVGNCPVQGKEGETKEEERRPLDRFVCPLTNAVMTDPVTTREGQNYERKALEKFVELANSEIMVGGSPLRQVLNN